MLVFIFGSQVMRGVIEEKTSRVVEVIISSVKPIQLMMGKIIGIALVGLTQFLIWIILTAGIATVLKTTMLSEKYIPETTQSLTQNIMAGDQTSYCHVAQTETISPKLAEFSKMFDSAMNQPWVLIILSFYLLFYNRLSALCLGFRSNRLCSR